MWMSFESLRLLCCIINEKVHYMFVNIIYLYWMPFLNPTWWFDKFNLKVFFPIWIAWTFGLLDQNRLGDGESGAFFVLFFVRKRDSGKWVHRGGPWIDYIENWLKWKWEHFHEINWNENFEHQCRWL